MEELKTLEGSKAFLNNIPEECRKNLFEVMKKELELLRKYKIQVTETEYYHSDLDKKDKKLSWIEYELNNENLKKILKNNYVRKPILSQELLDKIENKSLNPKEAEEVVSILTENCSLGPKTENNTCWNINTYGFIITQKEIDYLNSSTFTSFEEVLTRNNI